MKKRFYFLILLILVPIYAEATTLNNKGIEITEKQFEHILNLGYSKEEIMDMDRELFDDLLEGKIYSTTQVVKYFMDGYAFPGMPTPIVEISKEHYDKIQNQSDSKASSSDTHETNAKKLTLIINDFLADGKQKLVQAKLEWKYVPKVKSTDVFALMATSGTIRKTQTAKQIMKEYGFIPLNGCLRTNVENVTNYSTSHNNWNVTPTNLLAYTGVGISMPLDTNIQSCSNNLGLHFGIIQGYEFQINALVDATSGNQVTLKASYQHATSNVSVNNSKDYTFSTAGLGGVINFRSSAIASKYDGMGGVTLTA